MDYGDIALAGCKDNWLSKCIMWFTNSRFSHSFVTMPEILGIPMCIEAVEGGIDMSRYDTGYLNNMAEGLQVWFIDIDQEIKDEAIKNVINYLEVSYGFLEYAYFIWRKICLIFGKDIKSQDNWEANSGLICSQLCVTYLKACGLDDVLQGYGNGSIAPQDLQDIFKAHPETFVLKASYRL